MRKTHLGNQTWGDPNRNLKEKWLMNETRRSESLPVGISPSPLRLPHPLDLSHVLDVPSNLKGMSWHVTVLPRGRLQAGLELLCSLIVPIRLPTEVSGMIVT